MKTKKVYFVLQLLFFLVVPCVLIWVQYADGAGLKYKIPMTAVILMIFVFLFAKKVWLNPWLEKQEQKLIQIETLQLTAVEPPVIASLKREYRMRSMIQLVFRMVVPVLLVVLVLLTIKAVETGLVKLFGALMLCTVSFAFGIGCKVAEIYSVRLEHEPKKEKKEDKTDEEA